MCIITRPIRYTGKTLELKKHCKCHSFVLYALVHFVSTFPSVSGVEDFNSGERSIAHDQIVGKDLSLLLSRPGWMKKSVVVSPKRVLYEYTMLHFGQDCTFSLFFSNSNIPTTRVIEIRKQKWYSLLKIFIFPWNCIRYICRSYQK